MPIPQARKGISHAIFMRTSCQGKQKKPNNMKTIKLLMAMIIFLFSSCVTPFYLKPQVEISKNKDLIFHEGKPISISYLKNSTVAIFVKKNETGKLTLHVLYKNNDSINRVNILPENITVIGQSNKGKQSKFKVFSAAEYLKRMKNTQNLALGLMAAGASMNNQNAGYVNSKTNSNIYGSAYSNNGTYINGSANINSTTITYDASKVNEANKQSKQELYETAKTYDYAYNATEQGLIKSVTLLPRQRVEGNIIVKFDKYYSEKIFITIPVGSEIHEFVFIK
ncbi:MAG: hypothetical protein CVU00_11640 [Bacteroidetes bacterium HGW-Bacteroidetes-17]|jgi:hypothetical protein|nr:MAG: hypothetical protein CVU00_11640 [Bacteroidetes bacterium HGW-Bacteroidetes-17]